MKKTHCPDPLGVNVLMLVTREVSGFYSVQSRLVYKVLKEDKDARFSCEVSFFVPGAVRTVKSSSINITVHCEFTLILLTIIFKWDVLIICAQVHIGSASS